MFILAGKYKGKKLLADEKKTKPTQGKTKEAICSILSNQIQEAKVLDLFCGSGAVGFELLSKGAEELVGIDQDIRMAIKNASTLKASNSRFYKNDAERSIKKLASNNEKFDIIFIDPPYAYPPKEDLLLAISNFDILSPGGVILFETNKDTILNNEIGVLTLQKEYKYGYSKLSLYKK